MKRSINKENPKLGQKKLKDGRVSLYLEYYIGRTEETLTDADGQPVLYASGAMAGKPKKKITHIRRKETLSLYLTDKPRTTEDRQRNREIMELAERIRFEREQEFLQDKTGYRLRKDNAVDLYVYFQGYIDKYTKKDIRMVKAALREFRAYIEQSEYRQYKERMRIEQLTPDIVRGFVDYLQGNHVGEGGSTIFQRFKKVIRHATEQELIKKDPCTGIRIVVDLDVLKKDVLTMEEIMQLIHTHYDGENANIRNAFIFSLFCGLRFCDVKDLTYANIDFAAKRLNFEQNKTKGHSAASAVIMPLSDSLIHLVGTGARTQVIFPLPSHTMCLKALKHWVARAGIDKHITWHCARHSFAVNILNNGANIKTLASLLGHSGLRHTEKYTRAVDKLKEDAIKSLGEFADLE